MCSCFLMYSYVLKTVFLFEPFAMTTTYYLNAFSYMKDIANENLNSIDWDVVCH